MAKRMSVKVRKNGKLSVKLDEVTWMLIYHSLQCRLYYDHDEIETLEWLLLLEVFDQVGKMTGKTMVLKKSEFFALFQPGTMKYLDEPTQILLNEIISPLRKQLILNKTTNHASY